LCNAGTAQLFNQGSQPVISRQLSTKFSFAMLHCHPVDYSAVQVALQQEGQGMRCSLYSVSNVLKKHTHLFLQALHTCAAADCATAHSPVTQASPESWTIQPRDIRMAAIHASHFPSTAATRQRDVLQAEHISAQCVAAGRPIPNPRDVAVLYAVTGACKSQMQQQLGLWRRAFWQSSPPVASGPAIITPSPPNTPQLATRKMESTAATGLP
jgi:hypothetical protein